LVGSNGKSGEHIGAMLGVDGNVLQKAAMAIADGEQRGNDIRLLFDTNGLRAAIQGVADNAPSPNRRMLPRRRT